jgi:hypothetical protein
MNFGPSAAGNLLQSNQDRQLIRGGMPVETFEGGMPFIAFMNDRQDSAFRINAAKQIDKLFGDRIGKHNGFGHDLQNQLKDFIEQGSEELKNLPADKQLAAFVKAKEEEALKMLVEKLGSQKPSGLPADYNERKEYYDSIYKQALAPKIAEMFGNDVRLARHRSDLYGDGDAKVTDQERAQMRDTVLEILKNNSTTNTNPTPTNATNLTTEELIKQAVAATVQGVPDPASTPDGVSTVDIAKKAVAEFDKILAEVNNQRKASGQPELTKEEQTALLKQFTDAVAKDPIGGLYKDLANEVGTYLQTREQVKAYQDLLEQHKKTNESEFFKGLSDAVKQSIYAAQAQELQKLTAELANNLGISQEDAKELLENSHNPSPDVGSVQAVTDALMSAHEQAQIAAEQALDNPATNEQKMDLYQLLEGHVFNQKFQVTNPDGTTREVGIRELLDIETKKKISELKGTPEEIEKQKKELLDKQNEINKQLDQSYAAAIYQKRYQQAYDKALKEAGGEAGGEAAIKAAEAAGLKAGQAAFKYLSDRDPRGSLKDFNPAEPTLRLVQDLEKMAYGLRAFISQPIEVNAKPEGSQA